MFTIRGIPTAGIAVGTAFVLQRRASAAATAAAGDPVAEAGRFHAALERAKAELSALAEGEAVFAAHLEMAGDPMLAGLVEGRIAEKHLSAGQALGEACEEVCGMFAALDDDYLRGRTDDVRDVCARIRRVLSGETAHDPFAGLAPGTIVVADELAPSDTAQMDFSRVAGLVTAHGSVTSHVAIIARNKGIAALVGVAGCMRQVRTGDRLIIDGERGELIVDPDPATGRKYAARLESLRQDAFRCAADAQAPAVTPAGRRITVLGNAANVDEVRRALDAALINKWVALAFKSRVCLYEGTFRKYHSREPSSDKPWQAEYNADNKFLREAAAAAKEIMDKGPYSLVTGDVKTAYRSLFTSAGLLTQEVIFGREYSKELSAFHETSWYYYSPTYGAKIAMTKKFMNTYLTTRGTPFTDIDGYQTIDFIREFDGRDARMAQTVISPTYKMKISGRERLYSPNWKVTRTGYHPIKWSIDDDADNVLSKAASWNSLPILRYAEVLLNYAEAKAELGEMDAAVWDQTIALLRSRAGVTPVVPDKADPYMEAYFLNTVTDKWILEVRRERGIELCLEMGLRWDDDMRWHMGDLLTSDNNPWTGIWIGNTGYTYDFTGQSTDDNGDPVPDFYIRPGEDTEHSIAISNTGANQTFSLNAAGNIVWEYKRTWGEKKYLRPIPQTAITRNPNLEQNALWK